MTSIELKKLLLGTTLIAGFTALASAPTFAQDNTPIETTTNNTIEEDDEDDEEIIVTGSRLIKDSFSSVVPLQVIDTEVSRDLGLVDAAQILQTATVSAGTQIDTSFGGFVLDNGPGSQTVNLRGLGAGRTLLLMNGRRVAPSGIEGAPSAPDIGLLPSGLIDRFDIVLDGASSIYGSDAVAGVVNAVLRSDLDGFEVSGAITGPEQDNGEEYAATATYGVSGDNFSLMVGGDYSKIEAIRFQDRDFADRCNRNLEVTESGEIRTVDLSSTIGQRPDECKVQGLAGRIILLESPLGSIYNRGDGTGNLVIPGFSESSLFGVGFDSDLNGETDVTFQDFSINGRDLEKHLRGEFESFSLAAVGELNLEGEANVTPYFEVMYGERDSFQDSGAAQLFPTVPGNNPFNPCNPAAAGGVDCGLAHDALLTDPVYEQQIAAAFGLTPTQFRDFGIVDLFEGPTGPQSVLPVVSVDGDRTEVDAGIKQFRGVVGVKADLPFINFGSVNDWSGDVYFSYMNSDGEASRPGIRGDRLNYALGVNPVTGATLDAPCAPIPGLDADVANGCVPVNLFAPSLYQGVVGDFATAAERNYLFDSRDFLTSVDQSILSAFIQGKVFDLPGGSARLGLGAEIRNDGINSQPDAIAANGTFFGFFTDLGAVGEKTTREAFAELSLPLLADKPGFYRLGLDLSGRITDDEVFPTAETYSIKAEWAPVQALTLKGTIGTSFRAPNLRESFLLEQTGFGNVGDPCFAPDLDVDPITGEVVGVDGRTEQTLNNCRLAGIDPLTFNLGQVSANVEIGSGGAQGLDAETSDSYTLGFAFQQPFVDSVDLTLGATYWNIDIDNTIIEPGGQFLINECYVNTPNLSSPFCSRITRDAGGDLQFIDAAFLNRDNESAEGIDVNARFGTDVNLFNRSFEVSGQVNGTRLLENREVQSLGDRVELFDNLGEFAFPEWRARGFLRASYDDFNVSWETNYLGSVVADEDILAQDVFGSVADGFSETCLGPDAGDVLCRNVNSAGDYFVHSASVSYRNDDFSVGFGVRNVFDREPPLIDTASVFGRNNLPLGSGYDLNGRRFFLNVSKNF